MIIRKIRIENIRGIEFREISVDVHPNTPTFLLLQMDLERLQLQQRLSQLSNQTWILMKTTNI